jgi:protein TonB
VLLEVVVRPDGRAASVAVRQSSGHRMLDDSAAETVRTRWRFVPARRGGTPVESTVTVPIRFRIREG